MKNEALYRKTVDILYQAYFNDTLRHVDSCGCAVGNIVAANNGYKIIENEGEMNWITPDGSLTKGEWFGCIGAFGIKKDAYITEAKRQIESTGYTVDQIWEIEKAFESVKNKYDTIEDWMFNGLVAVLAVLDEIHEVADSCEVERFEKHYQTRKSLAV